MTPAAKSATDADVPDACDHGAAVTGETEEDLPVGVRRRKGDRRTRKGELRTKVGKHGSGHDDGREAYFKPMISRVPARRPRCSWRRRPSTLAVKSLKTRVGEGVAPSSQSQREVIEHDADAERVDQDLGPLPPFSPATISVVAVPSGKGAAMHLEGEIAPEGDEGRALQARAPRKGDEENLEKRLERAAALDEAQHEDGGHDEDRTSGHDAGGGP